MNNQLQSIVLDWIPSHSKVVDFGCGDGALLKILAEKKSATGYGVEIDGEKINACITNGVSVIQQDIDAGIQNYKGMGFDFAIMASSIQCLRRPRNAMQNILQVANECVITLPNFGNWELRLGLLKGKMHPRLNFLLNGMKQKIFIFVQFQISRTYVQKNLFILKRRCI